jgi:uncharacterized protein YbaP (TraB family)
MTRLNLALNSKLLAIYLFLNALAPVGACGAESTQAPPQPVPPPSPSPFLWKVAGPQTSWLFGTVHSDNPRVATLPPAVIRALDASRSFHPELELNADLGLSLAAKLSAADSPALSEQLGRTLGRRVARAGATLGLPNEILERLTPAIAALLFSTPPATNIAATVDGQLYTRAQERALKIVALETPDQQLALFEKLPVRQAIAVLTDALDEIDAGRPNEKKLLTTYASGDERALAALIAAEFSRSPVSRELAEPLLYARNRTMADALVPHLNAGGAFVAVGAGHLVGPRSVVELLRARGWNITRVAAP